MRSVRAATGLALAGIRSSPRLLAVGVASTVVTVAALFVTNLVVGQPGGASVLGPVVHVVVLGGLAALFRSLLLAVPLAVALPTIRGAAGRERGRSTGGRATATRAWRSLVSVPVTFAAGIAVAAVAFLPALAVYATIATAAQAGGYSLGIGADATFGLSVLGTLLPVVAASAVAAGTVGLVSPDVVEGAGLASAIRDSLLVFAHSPRRVLGHGFVVVGALLAPLLVSLGVAGTLSVLGVEGQVRWLSLLAASALSAVLAYSFGPVYRSAATGQAPRGGGGEPTRSRRRLPVLTRRRVLLSLAVSGLLVGTVGAVRVADVAPAPATTTPGYDPGTPPGATVEEGFAALSHAPRVLTRTVSERDPASSDGVVRSKSVVRFDPADREALVAFYAHDTDPEPGSPAWSLRGQYLTATTRLATPGGVSGESPPGIDRLRASDGWQGSVQFTPRYTPRAAGTDAWPRFDSIPPGTFRVVESSDGEVVLETRGVDAFTRLEELNPDRVVDGYLRVVVDAETGYPTRVVTHSVRVDPAADRESTERTVRHTVATIERGPVDVTRPPGAPPKGIVEFIADAVVY